VRQYPC